MAIDRSRCVLAAGFAGLLGIGVAFAAPAPRVGGHPGTVPPISSAPMAGGQDFLNSNCIGCHSSKIRSGGVVLENAPLAPVGPNADLWERVVKKLNSGEMPPPTVKNRPDAHQSAAFVSWLIASLDQYAAAAPDPGQPVIRRLTRAEYANAVRDLLGMGVNFGTELPRDPVAYSFDNNGDVLSLSPLLMEKYMSAARKATRLALGDKTIPSAIDTYLPSYDQAEWTEDVPFGARRAISVNHYFQVQGDYELRIFLGGQRIGYADLPWNEGVRFFKLRLKAPAGLHNIAIVAPKEDAISEGPIGAVPGPAGTAAGPLDVLYTAGVLPELHVLLDEKNVKTFKVQPASVIDLKTPWSVVPGEPYVLKVELEGPYSKEGSGVTASRSRILVCTPSAVSQEEGCARTILTTFVRRAFRRDVTNKDVEPFMAIYRQQRPLTSFEQGVQQALQAVMVSPGFLFRVESAPAAAEADGVYKVSDFELASRLSFLLWSSIPDDRLLSLAHAGRLSRPKVLQAEMHRMLADPRAQGLVDNFGMQFLGLQDVSTTTPDKKAYPDFTDSLRDELIQESRLFLKSVMLGNRSILDLVNANYTYLNEDLARHYGVPGVRGDQFRRVEFKPGDVRGGVLGQGSISLVTSHTNITSPVLRGKWVLTNLLASPPPNPPPGIPPIQDSDPSGRPLTGREQMEQHRKLPMCASCHARMDPFGFSMENLDVLGRWRAKDEAGPVNPAVTMPDGQGFSGVEGLRRRLTAKPDDFAQAFVIRMFTFALGRNVKAGDMPEIRRVVAETRAGGFRFNDIVAAVIESPQFQKRRKVVQS